MNFHGPARPLSESDVKVIAGYLGCHVAAVRAVLAVEAAGRGFGNDGRPIILNEPHILHRELSGVKRDQAVREGLAYAQWGAKPYPRTQPERYKWLERAMVIDQTAALRSCSWGMGQVMGFNHRAAGFNTVQDFVRAMTLSEGAHLYAMARFIVANNLQRHLRSLNWTEFARGYNGAGFAKNQYHIKLQNAYNKRSASERVTPPPATEWQLTQLITPETIPVEPPPPPVHDRPVSVAGNVFGFVLFFAIAAVAIAIFMGYNPLDLLGD